MKRYSMLLLLLAVGCNKPSDPPMTTSPAPVSGTPAMHSVEPGNEPVANPMGTATPEAAPMTSATPANPQQSFGKAAGKLISLAEAQQNPKMVVISTKITGNDPVTAAAQAYFSVGARAQMANFQNQYRISKEINDGKPLNYEQFMDLVNQLKIEFIPLPPWQYLGYDHKTGDIVLLENKAEKIALYKEKNIPIEEGDKQYDTP